MRGDSGKGAGGKTVASGGMNAGDPQWREQVFPLQIGDDAGDGFEAQVGDVGDVLPGGQDDLSAAVSQEADKSKDAGAGLSAAQGEEVGGALLRQRQRFEQSGTAGGGIAFRPGLELARGQCRGVEGVAAEEQGFASDDVAGDGEAGETVLACLSGVIETDDPAWPLLPAA